MTKEAHLLLALLASLWNLIWLSCAVAHKGGPRILYDYCWYTFLGTVIFFWTIIGLISKG